MSLFSKILIYYIYYGLFLSITTQSKIFPLVDVACVMGLQMSVDQLMSLVNINVIVSTTLKDHAATSVKKVMYKRNGDQGLKLINLNVKVSFPSCCTVA